MNTGRPRILLTTSSRSTNQGLRRNDAFTGRNYSESVAKAGGTPLMAASLDPALADSFLEGIDGVVFTGGVDVDPIHFGQQPHRDLGSVDVERDLFELALYRAARARNLPVLGVCRGLQLINVAQGGTLHQHLGADFSSLGHSQGEIGGEPYHTVTLTADSELGRAFGGTEIRTNSYHHQGIDRVGRDLRAVAHASDGLVEAVEGLSGPFLLGVQWHPEMSQAKYPEQLAPFTALIAAVTGARLQPVRV